jgi:hypothetical protein
MTVTATETTQVNGDTTSYSSKFLPKVSSIPVITSLKKQLFVHVPQAEAVAKYVHSGLGTAFSYTQHTPIEPMLIKLDTLAASGFDKFEKEVPIVNASTNEVLEKTKVNKAANTVVQLYVGALDFVFSIFDAYKGIFDPVLKPMLDHVETFLGTKTPKNESQAGRIKRLSSVVVEKVDSRVTPVINKTKETVSSVYTDTVLPIAQTPMNQFNVQKDKAIELLFPIVSEAISRFNGAESAAKDAWTKTKPDISGPNSFIPTLKSGLFAAYTFGYSMIYPASKKPSPNDVDKRVEGQTNGLVSGVELTDGVAHKRQNGATS